MASSAASAVKHKLHYFHLRSRGEIVRLVFAYGRVPLEEVTVPMGRAYMALKPTYPFQQLPMIEIDGKSYAQSIAIARYMAKQVGLYPMSDHLAALEVDMAVDTTADMLTAVVEHNFLERDAARKEKMTAKLNKYILPAYLDGLQKRVPATKPFLLGDQISLADLAIFNIVENLLVAEKQDFPIDLEGKFPKLLEVVENVKQTPPIAEYLADEKNHRPVRPAW
jgi:glutathione S-transferase